jgi:WD40 repeat protein
MREWGRFRRWIDSGREQVRLHRRLATGAREWQEAGREPSYLLRGSNLAQFGSLAAESTIALTELEREFVEASTAANELELARERRQNRRLRMLLAGAVVLLLLAVVAGVVALVSRSRAQQEAKAALGRQLGAEAVSQPRIDLAMLLARESLNLDRSPQTEGTLLATLLRTPAVVGTFTVPIKDRPQDVQVSPDGRSIAVETNNDVMRIYNSRTYRQTGEFPSANFPYAYIRSSGDLFALDPASPNFLLKDPRTGRTVRTLGVSTHWQSTHTSPIEPVVVTPDGRYAAFLYANEEDGSGAALMEWWNLAHNGPSKLVPLGGTGMLAATALPGDRMLVATNGRILTWDLRKLKKIRSVQGPHFDPSVFLNAALSPDGRTLAYGLDDGTMHFWNIEKRQKVDGLGAHSAAVQRIAFSPDSQLAVSTGDDGVAIVWNPHTGEPVERLTGHSGRVLGTSFSPDGEKLYTAGLDGTILAYDIRGSGRFGSSFTLGQSAEPFNNETVLPWTPVLAISPDSRFFAASGTSIASTPQSTVKLYSVSPLREVSTIALPGRSLTSAAWAGQRLVVGADRGLIRLWDVGQGTAKAGPILDGLSRKANVVSLGTSADGRVIAAAAGWLLPRPAGARAERGEFAIWRDGRLVGKPLSFKKRLVNLASVSADGSTAAMTINTYPNQPTEVLLVDTRTGRVERTITVKNASPNVTALGFAPDGTLATGTNSGIVNLWNSKTGQSIGHPTLVATAPVASIAFSPDGKTFATSGGSSGGIRIWVTATQQQLGADFPGGQGQWGNVAYTPNGQYLISVYSDGTANRWPVSVRAWEDHACAVAGRNFTPEEWRRFVGSRSYSKVCR